MPNYVKQAFSKIRKCCWKSWSRRFITFIFNYQGIGQDKKIGNIIVNERFEIRASTLE